MFYFKNAFQQQKINKTLDFDDCFLIPQLINDAKIEEKLDLIHKASQSLIKTSATNVEILSVKGMLLSIVCFCYVYRFGINSMLTALLFIISCVLYLLTCVPQQVQAAGNEPINLLTAGVLDQSINAIKIKEIKRFQECLDKNGKLINKLSILIKATSCLFVACLFNLLLRL